MRQDALARLNGVNDKAAFQVEPNPWLTQDMRSLSSGRLQRHRTEHECEKEMLMGFLPAFIDSDRFGAPALKHYQQLMEQAANARRRGEHRMAQQLASAAHKWAMDELVRVRHLDQANENLARATKQLNTAWDRDRSCASVEELGERHPETRRTIAAWVTAENMVRELETPTIPEAAPDEQSMTRWSRAGAASKAH